MTRPTAPPTRRPALRRLAALVLGVLLAGGVWAAMSTERLRDLAALSEAVYEEDPSKHAGQVLPDGYRRTDYGVDAETGFKYAVFEREVDGRTERVLAFAGTDFTQAADWDANVSQGSPWAGDVPPVHYQQALAVATRVKRETDADSHASLTVTGHSLGGGLGQYASLLTGTEAAVFNAAALGPGTRRQIPPNADDALIHNVWIDGDVVREGTSLVPGSHHYGEPLELDAPGSLRDDELAFDDWRASRYPDADAEVEALEASRPDSLIERVEWRIRHTDAVLRRELADADRRLEWLKDRALHEVARANPLDLHAIGSVVEALDRRAQALADRTDTPRPAPMRPTGGVPSRAGVGEPAATSPPDSGPAPSYTGPTVRDGMERELPVVED